MFHVYKWDENGQLKTVWNQKYMGQSKKLDLRRFYKKDHEASTVIKVPQTEERALHCVTITGPTGNNKYFLNVIEIFNNEISLYTAKIL